MNILSVLVLPVGMALIIPVLTYATTPVEGLNPPSSVVRYCIQDAQKARQEHQNDQFKDRPFYEYCVENTWHTSPITTRQDVVVSLLGK